MRCAVLHSGNYDLNKRGIEKVVIHAHKRNGKIDSYYYRSGTFVEWDVITICENICKVAEAYYESIEDKSRFELNEVIIRDW